ncbi:MAG TPA: hypothetical protein VEQ61_04560 [Thermoleophilaceae bacterium]|nr:hypothetical protein [Thermoleophilaceae bacterium]
MRFRRKIIHRVSDRMSELGLDRCPVCRREESLHADMRPLTMNVGGLPVGQDDPEHDPEANVLFVIRVVCLLCGYTLLFDSEQYHHGEEAIVLGADELEDEIDRS